MAVLEEAAGSAQKMTYHQDADDQVVRFKERWTAVHENSKEWVARMTTLVECWNKLDGNVGELSSWVNKQVRMNQKVTSSRFSTSVQDSAAPEGKSELSIEKLETQLNTLKTMFAEKQKLVADLEAYGPGGQGSNTTTTATPPPSPAPATAVD